MIATAVDKERSSELTRKLINKKLKEFNTPEEKLEYIKSLDDKFNIIILGNPKPKDKNIEEEEDSESSEGTSPRRKWSIKKVEKCDCCGGEHIEEKL